MYRFSYVPQGFVQGVDGSPLLLVEIVVRPYGSAETPPLSKFRGLRIAAGGEVSFASKKSYLNSILVFL